MPVYDYVCNDCHKTFELILTLKEHEVDAKCPKCGSKNVEQEATAFYAVTGKKSYAGNNQAIPCGEVRRLSAPNPSFFERWDSTVVSLLGFLSDLRRAPRTQNSPLTPPTPPF